MKTYTFTPGYPLSNFVDYFWYLDDWRLSHSKERIFPTDSMELIINTGSINCLPANTCGLRQRKKPTLSLINGIYSEFSDIVTEGRSSLLGVQFKPGGSYSFFDIPADQFHNQRISLVDLWRSETFILEEKLFYASSIHDHFEILEKFLVSKIIIDRQLHPAVGYALKRFQERPASSKVSEIVFRTGLSSRHFIKLFREQIGLSPKLFSRLKRFQHSRQAIAVSREVNWADLALDCGFYDQSHFVNEFNNFAGFSPNSYLQKLGKNAHHLPLSDER
jgi:AraC-like DNA-binding protein